jgi:hypothetical protein
MIIIMKDGPIQIRNEGVVRDIRELARLTQKPITEAVAAAVQEELGRAKRLSAKRREDRLRAIAAAVKQFKSLPLVGPMLTDDDLYDQDGLPK